MKDKFMAFRDAYHMLREVWFLYRKYAACDLADLEMEDLLGEAEQLRIKYHAPFADEILIAVVNELSRIAKMNERK